MYIVTFALHNCCYMYYPSGVSVESINKQEYIFATTYSYTVVCVFKFMYTIMNVPWDHIRSIDLHVHVCARICQPSLMSIIIVAKIDAAKVFYFFSGSNHY